VAIAGAGAAFCRSEFGDPYVGDTCDLSGVGSALSHVDNSGVIHEQERRSEAARKMARFASAERGHAAARCSSAGAICLNDGLHRKKPAGERGLRQQWQAAR